MKITIDDNFMEWILDGIKSYYCNELYECTVCPYYCKNRKHVQGDTDCAEIPLLEKLMIARKLYENGG